MKLSLKILIACCFTICATMVSCNTKSETKERASQPEVTSQAVSQQNAKILIYGSNTCDHCIDFRAKLDSVGLPYVFNDVELDQALYTELGNKIQAINYQGYVSFPV
ncbi:MAG: glutaredoxin domain-containing protein, partial [Cyclobacteriaceae bacterium]